MFRLLLIGMLLSACPRSTPVPDAGESKDTGLPLDASVDSGPGRDGGQGLDAGPATDIRPWSSDTGPSRDIGGEPVCEADRDCQVGLICRQARCIARYGGCSEDQECLAGEYCEPQYYACMSRCGGDRICPEGTSCAESFNTCMPYCDDPQDCPPGSTCVNEIEGGFCVPSGARACGWEDACPPGTVCDPSENRCLEDRGACVERADCGDGGRCVEGRCLHEPSPCGPADSCPENQMCQDDLCIPGGDAMRSCRRDEDCPDREVCHILVAACVPHPDNYPCEGDHQCPRGFECIEGGCRPPGARVCSEVRPCLAGEVCDEVTRTCRPDVGQACADDDDCPVHQFCDGTGRMHICFDDPCEIDQDCRIGARCNERSGRCAEEDRPPCVRDEDCPIEGEICLPERQVCGLLHEVVPDSCEGDGDCPDDMYCDTDNQVCVNEGNAGIGEVCERDLDCDAGQRCLTYRGIERCMLLCNQDDDCNGPTRCDLHEGHRVCLPQEQ